MVDQEALKSIEDLHRLKTEGVITEADFEKAKERLLFGVQPRTMLPAARGPAPWRTPTLTSGVAPFAFPGMNPSLAEHLGWITLPIKRYADFTGRSSRKEFWMFQIIFLALAVLGVIALGGSRDYDGNMSSLNLLLLSAVLMATLGLAVPQLAVQARRMHDQDRSGWLVLLNLLPYVGGLIVLVFMLLDGTPGDNRFGPDPRSAELGTTPPSD